MQCLWMNNSSAFCTKFPVVAVIFHVAILVACVLSGVRGNRVEELEGRLDEMYWWCMDCVSFLFVTVQWFISGNSPNDFLPIIIL